MKSKIFALLSGALLLTVSNTSMAQTKVNDQTTVYDLENSKLHVFQSGDVMGNVSFIVEGDKKVVILEQPMFWDNIKEFNSYVESLEKPIDKVVANYHSLGLAEYPSSKVVMPKAMVDFYKSEKAAGMFKKFEGQFGDKADFRVIKKMGSFEVPSLQDWAGVEMKFVAGAKSDFPAASILIDGKAYYTHFSPAIAHGSPMVIRSREAVDYIISDLSYGVEAGAQYFFGSHGKNATVKEAKFQIEYLKTVKKLMNECDKSSIFAQRLMVAYPALAGAEKIRAFAAKLYPNEVISDDEKVLATRVQDYFDMVSNLDTKIARGLWADDSRISIITPKSQFFGYESIMSDFLIKNFSPLASRKLSSFNEVINVYGHSANVQLYWRFDTETKAGDKSSTFGRETLIFEKIDGTWRLVHVHYSRMPQ